MGWLFFFISIPFIPVQISNKHAGNSGPRRPRPLPLPLLPQPRDRNPPLHNRLRDTHHGWPRLLANSPRPHDVGQSAPVWDNRRLISTAEGEATEGGQTKRWEQHTGGLVEELGVTGFGPGVVAGGFQ